MGLLRNGGRRGWERIEVSGMKSFVIERDVWQRYPSRVLHLVQCSAPVILRSFGSISWLCPRNKT